MRRVLKNNDFTAYKRTTVHELEPGDPQRRLDFRNWALTQIDEDENFARRIIFTDESLFIRHGQKRSRWSFHWAKENPKVCVQKHTQRVEKLNFWCGIWDDAIIGPFFIEGNLNGEMYRNLLQNEILPVLEPLMDANADLNPYFMQDDAPPHFSLIARNWLNEHFPNNWIGSEEAVRWRNRSTRKT